MKNILLISFLSFICCNNAKVEIPVKDYTNKNVEALKYCKDNGFNQDFYFLIDMSIHPGKNRFFVHDFKSNTITDKNLVTHGSCDKFEENPNQWEKAKFDNRTDSHCSMKGKFKIGKRDYSSWGIHVKYVLHGLEKSNSKAEERVVVLHSWDAVSDKEVYPQVSPLSWGCPAVSNEFMKKLDAKLKASTKPVLLWIIN
jgi:hypothetical protein